MKTTTQLLIQFCAGLRMLDQPLYLILARGVASDQHALTNSLWWMNKGVDLLATVAMPPAYDGTRHRDHVEQRQPPKRDLHSDKLQHHLGFGRYGHCTCNFVRV